MTSPVETIKRLASPVPIDREEAFSILQVASHVVGKAASSDHHDAEAQRLVLWLLERRDDFREFSEILEALTRQQGLYPYLPGEGLDFSASIAVDLHRPANLDDIVFHKVQGRVYSLLLAGENVILSAPTSFGKSLIIDAIIATGRYKNVVIVVPTLALIDETRRRLARRFRGQFKVITHLGQEPGDRNLFVLTQERVVDFERLRDIDFFVIDEFYKLDPGQDVDRAMLLNQALYRLFRFDAQFYMLGPNVKEVNPGLSGHLEYKFIHTDYATVVSEVTRVAGAAKDKEARLRALIPALNDQTLVFCSSPGSAGKVARVLEAVLDSDPEAQNNEAADWAAKTFHPEWIFVRALRHGIGLHHGKMPRALQQYVVRAFNEEKLKFLVCTSTLIEGVNTKAKNIIVYDNTIMKKKYDYFTFNNIRGRSGRMFEHFVGKVFLFSDPPAEELPAVDVPVFTQGSGTPESLLIQIADEDLTPQSKERIGRILSQEELPLEVLRRNRGLDPTRQLDVGREIAGDLARYQPLLSWRGFPKYGELKATCDLIWEYFVGGTTQRASVKSGAQLALRINNFRQGTSTRDLILSELSNDYRQLTPDEAVEDVLDFIRYWPTFNFPRFLMALDGIQRHVFQREKLPYGDYSAYAVALESSFMTPGLAALDEYGVPTELARRIAPALRDPQTLDDALDELRKLKVEAVTEDPFERVLLSHAQEGL